MQFTKTVLAVVLAVASATMAMPSNAAPEAGVAPQGVPIDELENSIQARAGMTCKLKGGALICAGKCYILGKAGGYCASNE